MMKAHDSLRPGQPTAGGSALPVVRISGFMAGSAHAGGIPPLRSDFGEYLVKYVVSLKV